MDSTKFIQNCAKALFKELLKGITLTAVMITIAIVLMAVALISKTIVAYIDAKPISLETYVKLAKFVIAVTT